MNVLIEIIYRGKRGEYILVTMIHENINFMVGDIYSHKTHKTDFNPKVKSDLPDGDYKIIERNWINHLATRDNIALHVIISD